MNADADDNPKVLAAKGKRDTARAAYRAAQTQLLIKFTREGEAKVKALRAASVQAEKAYTDAFRAAGGETLDDRLLKSIFGG